MSRIGKKPVPVPSGVTATVDGQTVKMKGPKGALALVLPDDVAVTMDKGAITVDPRDETKRARAHVGHVAHAGRQPRRPASPRASRQQLEITGVGYRAAVQGKNLQLALGYSHDIVYPIPDGIAIATPKPTEIVITGIDKQKVGQVAAEIRDLPAAGALQGQGREVRRRVHLPQGRQEEVTERRHGQAQSQDRAPQGARPPRASRRPPTAARACRCSARPSTSTRR